MESKELEKRKQELRELVRESIAQAILNLLDDQERIVEDVSNSYLLHDILRDESYELNFEILSLKWQPMKK